ncbi:8482_t:CDS:2, partial [Funneliformis mosseae]
TNQYWALRDDATHGMVSFVGIAMYLPLQNNQLASGSIKVAGCNIL